MAAKRDLLSLIEEIPEYYQEEAEGYLFPLEFVSNLLDAMEESCEARLAKNTKLPKVRS